jgi:hypothetical protein
MTPKDQGESSPSLNPDASPTALTCCPLGAG